MNPKDFLAATHRATVFVGREAAHLVGQVVVDSIKDNFDKESYQGKPWTPLKPDTIKRKTRKNGSTPKKLVNTGNLVSSIDYNADYNSVAVGALNERTSEYAGVHNEGLQAGRGAGFQMPQRQFMPIPGEALPPDVEAKIVAELQQNLDKIFNI